MAQGIGSAGVGAGCFLLAILQEMLIVEYGWRGALFVMAGIVANLSVFGVLFFTPETVLSVGISDIFTYDIQNSNFTP